jgi:hypothetical protein
VHLLQSQRFNFQVTDLGPNTQHHEIRWQVRACENARSGQFWKVCEFSVSYNVVSNNEYMSRTRNSNGPFRGGVYVPSLFMPGVLL